MWHNLGKVNVTKGSDVVTGVGTKWVENVRVGDAFQGPDGKLYQVINVASDEALAISPAYEGSTAKNLDYWIVPIPGFNKIQADRLSLIISKLDGDVVTATEAAEAAQVAALQAQTWQTDAELSAISALQSEQNAALAADIAEQARDDAVAIVTDGGGSTDPEPGKFPIAGSTGTIKQDWIENLQFELDALRVARNKLMYGDGPYPVLDLQFQGAKHLDPRVTFTRATPDWDWEGKRYEPNEPIVTDEGLRLWGVRTNYAIWSGDASQPVWSMSSGAVRKKGQISSRGDNTAVLCIEDARGVVSHQSTVSEKQIATRFVFKPVEVEGLREYTFHIRNTSQNKSGRTAVFYLASQALGNEEKGVRWLEKLDNGFFAVNLVSEPDFFKPGDICTYYWGKTVAGTVDNWSIIADCLQVEGGDKPTPYIPTEDSQVTVGVSRIEVSGDVFKRVFNPLEGTISWSVGENDYKSYPGSGVNVGILGTHGSTTTGSLGVIGNFLSHRNTSGVFVGSLTARPSAFAGKPFKMSFTYSTKGVSLAVNGEVVSRELDVTEFTNKNAARFIIEGLTRGYVRTFSYYDKALTEEQVMELTR